MKDASKNTNRRGNIWYRCCYAKVLWLATRIGSIPICRAVQAIGNPVLQLSVTNQKTSVSFVNGTRISTKRTFKLIRLIWFLIVFNCNGSKRLEKTMYCHEVGHLAWFHFKTSEKWFMLYQKFGVSLQKSSTKTKIGLIYEPWPIYDQRDGVLLYMPLL